MNAPDAVDNQARNAKKSASVFLPPGPWHDSALTRYEHLLFKKKKSKEKSYAAVWHQVCALKVSSANTAAVHGLAYVESDEARREVAQNLDDLHDCDKTDLALFLLYPTLIFNLVFFYNKSAI